MRSSVKRRNTVSFLARLYIARAVSKQSGYESSQDMIGILAKQEPLKAIQAHIDQLININSEAAQNGDFDEQFDSLHKEMYAIMDELAEADKTKSKIDTAADSIGDERIEKSSCRVQTIDSPGCKKFLLLQQVRSFP